jgi:hypothetical protein
MKRIVLLLLVLSSCAIMFSNVSNPIRGTHNPVLIPQSASAERDLIRNAPNWSFSRTPVNVMESWFDYMPGSYNGLPMQIVPDNYGGGYFMIFHAKSTSAATRKVYYAKIASGGTVEGTAAITTSTNIEGYPAMDLDTESGKPMYSWHSNVDADTQSEIVLTWDKLTGGTLGTFSPVGIAINNPITYPAPFSTTDNVFYWPEAQIGPSPTAGMRRIYLMGRNNITHAGTGNTVENVYIAYADFDTAILEAGTALTWSYTSIPDLDTWNHDTTTWRRPYVALRVGTDGRIFVMGYHTSVTGGQLLDEADLDVFVCDNYGAGAWQRYSVSSKIPSWNPPTSNGQGPGYFTGISDENVYWRITDSGHMNTVLDSDGMLHFSGFWNLMTLSGTTQLALAGLNTVKEAIFDTDTFDFTIREVYPIAGLASDNLVWQPWDEDADGEVDAYNPTTGDPILKTDWNYPYWSATVHNNAMGYQYNNFKLTEPNADGWMACVWQNSNRARAYNFHSIGQFQPYANVPEIYIAVSDDNGANWSEPIVINSVEVAQFASNIPMYVYPADKIKNMGMVNGHPTGRLALMYYHDNTWGSYNVTPAIGANDGGFVRFMSIDIDMGSLVSSGINGTVRRADNQQTIINATITAGEETTATNENGTYSMGLLPGVYSVTASATGYAAETITNVNITPNLNLTLDFNLYPAVSVFGNVRSLNPPALLEGAIVSLTGATTYEAVTNNLGNFTIPGVRINQTYLYVVLMDGYQMATGVIQVLTVNFNMGVIILQPVSNDDDVAALYTDNLLGAAPNPFRDITCLTYTLEKAAPVQMEIYNVRGQLINTIAINDNAKGLNTAVWDGKDSQGRKSAAGVYFCRMKTPGYSGTQKVMLLK